MFLQISWREKRQGSELLINAYTNKKLNCFTGQYWLNTVKEDSKAQQNGQFRDRFYNCGTTCECQSKFLTKHNNEQTKNKAYHSRSS